MMDPSSSGEHLAQAIGPQVRSRVTVVCAECKRLKLKCDRRAPCGSCTKRDTVARCIYSPAAAEKVDLHSLNNRLITVESQLAQISAPGVRFPSSSSSSTTIQLPIHTINSYNPHEPSIDDITAIWWEEIDIPESLPVQSSSSDSREGYIKSEPASHPTLPLPSSNPPSSLPLPLLLPPISCYYAPHPSSSSSPIFMKSLLAHLPFAPRRRTRLYEHAEEAFRMIPGPCFSWRVWKERAEGIWRYGECESTSCSTNDSSDEPSRPSASSTNPNTSSRTPTDTSKTDTARTIFFGPLPAPPPSPPPSHKALSQTSSKALTPSLPLFASVSGAFALALLVEESAASASAALQNSSSTHLGPPSESERVAHNDRMGTSLGPKKSRKDPSPKENLTSPALLHALSRQAICVWEGGVALSNSGSNSNSAHASEYDLDYVAAIVLGVLFVVLCDKGCTTERHGNGSATSNTKEGWILGEIGKLVNIARTMGLGVDPDLTPGKYGLYESEARRRAWWDIWWWDAYTSTLSSRAPLIPLHAFSTRLPLDVDEEVFTSACTSAPLLSPTGKEGVGRWFGMRVRLAQLVKDINCRTSLLSSLEQPSALLSLEHASQCETEIKQWLSDLPPAFRMGNEGMGEESCVPPQSMALSSNASHGGTPPTLLAQRLDILMTTHRLAMGLYLPSLRPHSSPSSQSDSHSNARRETSPQIHQARVGALTAAHGVIRAGRDFVELACTRPDLVRRKDGLGLSLCCSLVYDVHSGFSRGVEMGYSKALFDASIVCATSALRDPSAVWARTAVEDAKMGLVLLRDLRDLCPALDVSVLEALLRKLDSGGSGAGSGSKRKREGWDEGDGRDAVPVPGGSGAGGNGEENVPLIPVPVVSTQEPKLRSPSHVGSNSNAAENTSTTNDANKEDSSASEPRRTYPAIVIPSKFPPRKDRVKDRDLLKDGQRERERGDKDKDKDKDRSREKDKDRKKTSYPSVGFRVRPGKEPSPLARVRPASVGTPTTTTTTTTTTQGISGQSMPTSSQPISMSDQSIPASSQPMPTSSQSMSASQHSVMSQPPSVASLQPSSLVSTPIDRSSYHSTPTSMSQEGGVDFSLPFGAAYEPQPQPAQKFTPYDYASSSASPFSYPDTPQYAQFGGPPSTPTSFAPPSQLPHYSGAAPQPQSSFPTQSQFPASQASYSEHPLPSQQQQQQQQPGRFSFGPQFPETGLVREYYGSQEKQPAQRQGYQQEYPGEQQAVYGVKSSIDQHLASQQGYAGGQQGYMEQTWTEGSEGQYWSSYPAQPQLRYQE